MIKHIKFLAVFVGLLLFAMVGEAQPGGRPPGQGPPIRPPGNPRPFIPIDGGISILAAAGIAYGARKVYIYRKQNQDPEQDHL
jgi:hypothetical protein